MNIPILMYHQIDEPPPRGTSLRGLVVAPRSFAWQMSMLRLLGYRGLSMTDLEPYLTGKKIGKVVGITFDDGYQNNVVNALPILKSNNFSATCYAVSSEIGGTNAWDRGKVDEKPLMTLDDWHLWKQNGMDIGSHTRTHANLIELRSEEAWQEISTSKLDLQNAIGCEVRHFCYPYGWYSYEHEQMTKEAGYITATTTNRGRVHSGDNNYNLKRIMVARATNPLQFFLKIATAYENKRA